MVSIDCEMVGVGPGGKSSSLARATVINNLVSFLPRQGHHAGLWAASIIASDSLVGTTPDQQPPGLLQGNVLLDVHVRQREKVTDYRTHVSGIRPNDLRVRHPTYLWPPQPNSRYQCHNPPGERPSPMLCVWPQAESGALPLEEVQRQVHELVKVSLTIFHAISCG